MAKRSTLKLDPDLFEINLKGVSLCLTYEQLKLVRDWCEDTIKGMDEINKEKGLSIAAE